ncbi:hypothetical protein M422DRAFT_238915 [Sphaerobolus stellatus SS14]|nr:hypothetical protein M422DRAFT_238915 [Sphaerobolus stellatus SS14]
MYKPGALLLVLIRMVLAITPYQSLAGISERDLAEYEKRIPAVKILTPPGPLKDNSIKLVNDPEHPHIAAGLGDLRSRYPGLNTLASHGYLPRNSVVTPTQLIDAVQEAYNLGNNFVKFLVYQGFLVNDNHLTNWSIGGKNYLTGPDPPEPVNVGGLSTHGTFEDDTTDAFIGNNQDFNETLFQKTRAFSLTSLTASVMEKNPNFIFVAPRILSAYSEIDFPTIFFVGRKNSRKLDLDAAQHFLKLMMFLSDFHRQPKAVDFSDIDPLVTQIFNKHPFTPGENYGRTDSFITAPQTPGLFDFCGIYKDFVMRVLKNLYPNPQGQLRMALSTNLVFFYWL